MCWHYYQLVSCWKQKLVFWNFLESTNSNLRHVELPYLPVFCRTFLPKKWLNFLEFLGISPFCPWKRGCVFYVGAFCARVVAVSWVWMPEINYQLFSLQWFIRFSLRLKQTSTSALQIRVYTMETARTTSINTAAHAPKGSQGHTVKQVHCKVS